MSFKNWPVLACYVLVAAAAAALWGTGQKQAAYAARAAQPQTAGLVPSEAALELIEPASGPEAAHEASPTEAGTEGEHQPKTSFTGKVLSAELGTPSISIGVLKVETRKDLKADAQLAFTPAELRDATSMELLKRRFRFTPYAHDALRGPENAPITLVEFSDLSCVQCTDDLKKAEELYVQYGDKIRYIQVYLPVDSRNQTNLAAFYGKVAQRGGRFWEFRQALFDLKESSPEGYFDALVKAGVPAVDARRWLTTEARRFYRELDADAQLSRALGLDKPPHFFVNGIHVGDGGIARAQLGAVLSYENNYTHYQLDSLAHD